MIKENLKYILPLAGVAFFWLILSGMMDSTEAEAGDGSVSLINTPPFASPEAGVLIQCKNQSGPFSRNFLHNCKADVRDTVNMTVTDGKDTWIERLSTEVISVCQDGVCVERSSGRHTGYVLDKFQHSALVKHTFGYYITMDDAGDFNVWQYGNGPYLDEFPMHKIENHEYAEPIKSVEEYEEHIYRKFKEDPSYYRYQENGISLFLATCRDEGRCALGGFPPKKGKRIWIDKEQLPDFIPPFPKFVESNCWDLFCHSDVGGYVIGLNPEYPLWK